MNVINSFLSQLTVGDDCGLCVVEARGLAQNPGTVVEVAVVRQESTVQVQRYVDNVPIQQTQSLEQKNAPAGSRRRGVAPDDGLAGAAARGGHRHGCQDSPGAVGTHLVVEAGVSTTKSWTHARTNVRGLRISNQISDNVNNFMEPTEQQDR
jgi:hypothetical protein